MGNSSGLGMFLGRRFFNFDECPLKFIDIQILKLLYKGCKLSVKDLKSFNYISLTSLSCYLGFKPIQSGCLAKNLSISPDIGQTLDKRRHKNIAQTLLSLFFQTVSQNGPP